MLVLTESCEQHQQATATAPTQRSSGSKRHFKAIPTLPGSMLPECSIEVVEVVVSGRRGTFTSARVPHLQR